MPNPKEILNNRYQLGPKIGEGGTAQVFEAQDLLLKRTVAVKILDADFSDEQVSFKRFQVEAHAIAALDHPNIIAIYDFGFLEAEQSAYLVMPYVRNGPLSERLRAGHLPLEETALYLEQVASALDYAHSQGVLHRDVKPSNVLMRADKRVVLSDFGFAKITDDPDRITHTQARGTVEYIAPEQIYGMVSAASDEYSLGVMLYQMVSGALPFTGKMQSILEGHSEKLPPPLHSQPAMQGVSANLLSQLDAIMARALAKKQNERFPNCLDLSQAFQKAIQNQAVQAVIKTPSIDPISPQAARTKIDDETFKLAAPIPVAHGPRTVIRAASLIISTQPEQPSLKKVFELTAPTLKLGRLTESEIYLPLATISRHHATLYLEADGNYRIVDNQSRNGLLFRGKFIKEKILTDGDVIEIGKPGISEYVVLLKYIAPVLR